jgi:hypothetical protein
MDKSIAGTDIIERLLLGNPDIALFVCDIGAFLFYSSIENLAL